MDEKEKNILIVILIILLVGLVILGVQVVKRMNAQKEIMEQPKNEFAVKMKDGQAQRLKEFAERMEREEILRELRSEMLAAREYASQQLLIHEMMEMSRKRSAELKALGIDDGLLEHQSENMRLKDALERKRAAEEAYFRYLTNQDESQAKK